MLIISSSAKTLDFETPYNALAPTGPPEFLAFAEDLHSKLINLSLQELKSLLGVSEKIAVLNFERIKAWSVDHRNETEGGNSRPALFAYKGDVFRQLSPHDYSREESEYAANSVCVMSGLYGVVRGFDLIQPYRLEMAAQIDGEKLNRLWQEKVTEFINERAQKEGHVALLDLASVEYSSAVNKDRLNIPVIKVDFKERKDGKLKVMGIFAKRARGMMIDYCIRNQIHDPVEIQGFTGGGYKFAGEEKGVYLFVR